MNSFIEKFGGSISSTLECFDRVIFKGPLPFQNEARVNGFVLAGSQRFDPRIIEVGKERERLKKPPIEKRPDRPLHIYGNAVRRRSGR